MKKSPEATIADHPFFCTMKPEHLQIIAGCATEAKFKRDDILFREGEPANQFYLIQKGQVVLEAHRPANGTVPIQTLGPDELLGWSWLFPPFVWHFRARAVESVEMIVINGGHLLTVAERDHDFGYELMKRITQVLVHRLQTTRELVLQHSSEPIFADHAS